MIFKAKGPGSSPWYFKFRDQEDKEKPKKDIKSKNQ